MIEGDASGYSAYVPELPTIIVAGSSLEEIDSLASEAIRLYWETMHCDPSPTALVRGIEVELPA